MLNKRTDTGADDRVTRSVDDVVTLRLAMLANGYWPIPLRGNKNPSLKGWPKTRADEVMVRSRYWRKFTNTGSITKNTSVIDVDIKDTAAAEAIATLVRQRYSAKGKLLQRIGEPPKFAIPFKTDEPFAKKTLKLWPPDEQEEECKHRIEILGDGQQTVVDGIHPGTGRPYTWTGGEPWTVARAVLPVLTEVEATAFLGAARDVLGALGWRTSPLRDDDEPLPDYLKNYTGPLGTENIDDDAPPIAEIKAALRVIASDDYETWYRVGAALWVTYGDEGWPLFDEWSKKSDKCDATKCAAQWEECQKFTKVSAGTIFYYADEADENWRDAYDAGQDEEPKKDEGNGEPKKDEAKTASEIIAEAYDFPAEETIARDEWVLGKHLLRGEVSGTAAMGGTGKRNLAIVEALAMASGKQLLHDTVAPARVVLVNLEDKRNRMAKRIAAAMRHYGLTKDDIDDRLFVIARGEIKISRVTSAGKRGNVDRNEKTIKALTDFMIEKKADVLSIDSFIRTHGVNENDNSAIQKVVACFEDIASNANCAVHLWHHSRKMGGEKATVEAARGAMAFIDACRSVRILETMTRKEWEDIKLDDNPKDNPGYYFRAFNGKRNFAPPSEEAEWFKYVNVILNNADERFFFDEGDHVGVVTPWDYPRANIPKITEDDIKRALAAINIGGPYRADPRTEKEPWVGIPIAKALGHDLADKRVKRAMVKLISEWVKAGRLARVTEPDRHGDQRDYIKVAS